MGKAKVALYLFSFFILNAARFTGSYNRLNIGIYENILTSFFYGYLTLAIGVSLFQDYKKNIFIYMGFAGFLFYLVFYSFLASYLDISLVMAGGVISLIIEENDLLGLEKIIK